MATNTNMQAEKLSLLARDLTLFPESRDAVLAAHNMTSAHLTLLEENPIFQASVTHALQQLQDDPIYPQRLLLSAQTTVLAQRLLTEAIGGTMEHGNSIKVLEFSAKLANMEPPKVTRASTVNTTSIQSSGVDPSVFKAATKLLTTEELGVLDALIAKMNTPAPTTE